MRTADPPIRRSASRNAIVSLQLRYVTYFCRPRTALTTHLAVETKYSRTGTSTVAVVRATSAGLVFSLSVCTQTCPSSPLFANIDRSFSRVAVARLYDAP